ncbi:hypothetical protein PF005_g7689 [Phytophthora fragariae]|nr:hypothetical protein PF003_g36384 [Phytophthora fragariae]KAE9005107.1 hypothetical protein PF011_g12180 [Phytophthora fragariae]KAE9106801.1 hypothetical protein PF010_g12498 [Phytophthora fragariae]KAE9108885.1 hypothetical protein PF007_g12477 [Phytophthora fragariae]KAE9139953.1 hypothetical protein PF006_g13639 [Phytophthora fragariae]
MYQPVFVEVGGDVEDPNRCQSLLSEGVSTFSPAMEIQHQHLTYAVRSRNSRYEPRTYSFMHPKRGGVDMIVALSPGKRPKVFLDTVDTTKEKVLELRPSDAVLFRADLIHCGMGYDQYIFRLHRFMTIPGPHF